MVPRTKRGGSRKSQHSPSPDPDGMFHGMVVFLVPGGVQARRLEIWKQKLTQMGAVIDEKLSKRVTHIFAVDYNMLLQQVNQEQLHRHKRIIVLSFSVASPDHLISKTLSQKLLHYQWLENCLKLGEKVAEDPYMLNCQGVNESDKSSGKISPEPSEVKHSNTLSHKRIKVSCDDSKVVKGSSMEEESSNKQGDSAGPENQDSDMHGESEKLLEGMRPIHNSSIHTNIQESSFGNDASGAPKNEVDAALQSSYNPPDLNKNITEIFGKLINIYRALGEERRSFSYYKAIPVIEKLPFKITSVDQVKNLPTIGKSLQDHIHEILTTGKLSKLEHFENDEKARTVSHFGEVWGIGPATALKLYEKGHRTLDDLRNDNSLTAAQKIGLKYFDDIKKRIPRHEAKDMEMLLQKAAYELLSGVIVICGGSYRRGKASCGDLDIVITHPDGESHKGFLPRYVQHLKDINFLREDLVFSMHSTEGTDSGVDTYFGLCTYPGRELRHRIDLKVYPRDRYAFGLVAWTGNDVLNRRLRLLAESKGYRLDDTGLYFARTSAASPGKRVSSRSSTRMTCYTEKEVFDVLGFPWLEPHERNL